MTILVAVSLRTTPRTTGPSIGDQINLATEMAWRTSCDRNGRLDLAEPIRRYKPGELEDRCYLSWRPPA